LLGWYRAGELPSREFLEWFSQEDSVYDDVVVD
jgi:hypothetical protein